METPEYTYGFFETSIGVIAPIFFLVFLYFTISTIKNKDKVKVNNSNYKKQKPD